MSVQSRAKFRRAVSWLFIALLCAAVALPLLAEAQRAEPEQAAPSAQAGTIRFDPATVTVAVGGAQTLHIMLDDVEDYYGLDLRFSFDPALVTVPTGAFVLPGDVFDPTNFFVIRNQVDNVAGTAWLSISNLNPALPFSGSGRVCDIMFVGLADGIAPLTFTYVKGSTRDGAALYPTQVNGTVYVGNAAPTPEPTPTSWPIGLRDAYNVMVPLVARR